MITSSVNGLNSNKSLALFFKEKEYIKKPICECRISSGGGGNGNANNPKKLFDEEPENYLTLPLFIIFSKKENSELFKFSEKNYKNNNYQKKVKDVILKSCDSIPKFFLCDTYEDLFYQNYLKNTNQKKAEKYIDDWYSSRDHIFSESEPKKKMKKNEDIYYFFKTSEPKIKSFKIFSKKETTDKVYLNIERFKIFLISNILNISFGERFKFNLTPWKRFKSAKGNDMAELSIKDQELGDFGKFLDLTLKLTKKPSLSIEPEVTLIDKQISSSVSFIEKNFLGTGISVKQKILFRKFKIYYMKIEIDDNSLKKYQNIYAFGKYLKNFSSIGFIYENFLNEKKNACFKLGSGLEVASKKQNFNQALSSVQLKASLMISKINFLKSHIFFISISMNKFSRSIGYINSMILNSEFEPAYKKLKLLGLIFVIENQWNIKSYSRDLYFSNKKKEDKIRSLIIRKKENFRMLVGKYLSINTLLSKNFKFTLILNYKKKNLSINLFKKIIIKFEIGKLLSLSFDFNNYGKSTIMLN